jgi:hypothetical protein
MRPALALAPALAAAIALGGCGYRFANRAELKGGAEAAFVAPFENLSAEPELGAAVAAALRDELARRGAAAGAGARAVIDGEVRSGAPAPSTLGPRTYRIALEARARLRVDGKLVAERTVRREADFLAGADPNESETRRAIALRRLAVDVARDLVRAFEG